MKRMEQVKTFLLNGQLYYTEENLTIFNLVNYFNYNYSLLVLEHNNLISNQKDWKNKFLQNQDKIEIVTIVGGG